MKKTIAILVSLIMVAAVFAACKKTVDEAENTTTAAEPTITESTSTQQATESSQTTQSTAPETQTKMVITAFNAVEGAEIYDQYYDSDGYLESCQFHKKCEVCGYVSNDNGQARSNLTTSFHCTECGNDQHVEITATEEWVEVPINY